MISSIFATKERDMETGSLAQRVKDLRKRNYLSQATLAKNSGLSLRTVQRIENGSTEPTGETLKRLSSSLGLTPSELVDWNSKTELPKKTIKTKYEYLHILDTKLLISKTDEIKDLVEDYEKSVTNVFKTLMVFFITIPIFTALAVIFYNLEKTGLALYAASFALCFLIVAFYTVLFTSGAPSIKIGNIAQITIQRKLFNTVLVILNKESGRLKERFLILEKNQVDSIKNSLKSEKLIQEQDIQLTNPILNMEYMVWGFFLIIIIFLQIFQKTDQFGFYSAIIVLIPSLALLVKMVLRLLRPRL